MQIGYTHSAALHVDEPIMSSSTGTISAITRNGRLLERVRFDGSLELSTSWIYLWVMHGKPTGHSDRPYITIKRDNAQ